MAWHSYRMDKCIARLLLSQNWLLNSAACTRVGPAPRGAESPQERWFPMNSFPSSHRRRANRYPWTACIVSTLTSLIACYGVDNAWARIGHLNGFGAVLMPRCRAPWSDLAGGQTPEDRESVPQNHTGSYTVSNFSAPCTLAVPLPAKFEVGADEVLVTASVHAMLLPPPTSARQASSTT